MTLTVIFALLFSFTITISYDQNDCHFVRSYSSSQLLNSSSLQEEFLLRAAWWQGAYGRNGIGLQTESITMSDVLVDFDTFEPYIYLTRNRGQEWMESDAYGEAIHLALLAIALDGDIYARQFVESSNNLWPENSIEEVIINHLWNKINLYNELAGKYPGYGGYLPAFDSGVGYLVPAELPVILANENSNFCWAMIAVAQVLYEKHYLELSTRYINYVSLLANSGLAIFLHTGSKHKPQLISTIRITNLKSPVDKSNYRPAPICSRKRHGCNLAHLPTAETFLVFLSLYANWTDYGGMEAMTEIWSDAKKFLHPAIFGYQNKNILVEQRPYFLADELSKYLILPYLDIPICEQLFLNAEMVRIIYSNIHQYPGLLGRAWSLIETEESEQHLMKPGIPELSERKNSTKHDAIQPHAAFPLFLHPKSRSYGIVWYATMLNSTKSQTSIGAMDTIKMTGDLTSQSASWRTGAMSVLAFGGGRLSKITRRYLKETDKYDQFYRLFELRYNSVFGNDSLKSEDFEFVLPSNSLPQWGDYCKCNPNVSYVDAASMIFFGQTWIMKSDFISITSALISLPFVLFVFYIAIFKHRNEKAIHRWFTLHLFAVHLISIVVKIGLFIVQYALPMLNVVTIPLLTDHRITDYIDRFYLPHCFTLIMAATLFAMSSALLFPFFYQRWLLVAIKWNIYMAICHLLAIFSTFEGFKIFKSVTDLSLLPKYVMNISIYFYVVLFGTAVLAAVVIIRMKKSASNNKNTTTQNIEWKTLLSILFYAIVPTIWCLGSQGDHIVIGLDLLIPNYRLNVMATSFRSTYPLAHSIATLLGLGPYRRSIMEMCKPMKRGLSN